MELEILFELAVIMVGAAVLGTLFLFLRQPIVIAYIAIGFALGPGGLGLIKETTHLEQIAHVGVILLLFLIGLNLQPQKLLAIFQKTALLTMSTSLLFALVATTFALLLQFSLFSSLLIGAAMMFSSTVVGLKLVPTTTLHHKRTGEVMTGVLLLQDLLAILLILLLSGGGSEHPIIEFGLLLLKFIALGIALFFGVRGVVLPLLTRFDVVQEYTFVATLDGASLVQKRHIYWVFPMKSVPLQQVSQLLLHPLHALLLNTSNLFENSFSSSFSSQLELD